MYVYMYICFNVNLYCGACGKQHLAEERYPVEIEVINNNSNNAYELICGYALNITRSWHN